MGKLLGWNDLKFSSSSIYKPCTICLRAEQTRNVFLLSLNNASVFFILFIVIYGNHIILPLFVVLIISLQFFMIVLQPFGYT